MPTIDQATGNRDLTEPTRTLRTFRTGAALRLPRPEWKDEVFFGQNAVHLTSGGALRVGDSIKVVELQQWAQNMGWS